MHAFTIRPLEDAFGAHLAAKHVSGDVDPAAARAVHRARTGRLAEPGDGLEAVQAPHEVAPVPCPAGVACACSMCMRSHALTICSFHSSHVFTCQLQYHGAGLQSQAAASWCNASNS